MCVGTFARQEGVLGGGAAAMGVFGGKDHESFLLAQSYHRMAAAAPARQQKRRLASPRDPRPVRPRLKGAQSEPHLPADVIDLNGT